MKMIRAFAFDCFHTLVDLSWDHLPIIKVDGHELRSTAPVLQPALAKMGHDIPLYDIHHALVTSWQQSEKKRADDYVETSNKVRIGTLLQLVGAEQSEDNIRELAAAHAECLLSATRPMDGALELLSAINDRGIPIAIVSNFDRTTTVHDALAMHGMSALVNEVIVSDAVGYCKPSPRIFDAAIARLTIPPQDILFIGDQLAADMEGAVAAGMQPIWIRSHSIDRHKGVPEGIRAIDSLRELLALL